MLSIENPELCREILNFPSGIHSIRLSGEHIPRIIIKLPISYLLPAKVNQGFSIYIVPVNVSGNASIGLMCAFFDDADNPLVSWRLLAHDTETLDLLHALTKSEALIHLFDDHNREFLGYRAKIDVPLMAKIRLEHIKLPDFTHESFHEAHEQAMRWFGLRNAEDDLEAIQICFMESLFQEDLVISDVRHELYQFHGSKGYGFTSLERAEPGSYQELDIILQLQRIFKPNQIYHAPKRHYDKEEIADVVVITDDVCLIIQAKDSPNTEKMLKRTLQRKQLVSVKQLNEALNQIAGAVNYVDKTRPLRMIINDRELSIELGNRRIISLALVRELFMDTYAEYSEALFNSFRQTNLPCIALDYGELHEYTSFCIDENGFLDAYFQVFNAALKFKKFPRLRFGVNDAEAVWRSLEKRER